jgi:formyltetrahydrofolate deformylase
LGRGELQAKIPLIVSNHPDLQARAETYGIPFYHLPVTQEIKAEQESADQDLLFEHGVDLVVLARHMQILTPKFVDAHPNRIINIHHSLLPAFAGADPYRRAHGRGLEDHRRDSPLRHRGARRRAHHPPERRPRNPPRQSAEDLARLGMEVERRVLARAVRWHLEDRILVKGNRTVIFG